MNKLITISLVIFFYSCSNDTVAIPKREHETLKNNDEFSKIKPFINGWTSKYTVLVIDSCEYIYMETNNANSGITLTHKGNCKKCKHE